MLFVRLFDKCEKQTPNTVRTQHTQSVDVQMRFTIFCCCLRCVRSIARSQRVTDRSAVGWRTKTKVTVRLFGRARDGDEMCCEVTQRRWQYALLHIYVNLIRWQSPKSKRKERRKKICCVRLTFFEMQTQRLRSGVCVCLRSVTLHNSIFSSRKKAKIVRVSQKWKKKTLRERRL